MKWQSHFAVVLWALVASTAVFADHTLPQGSIEQLERDTAALDNAVRYSSLRYQVKVAVSHFAWDISHFTQCVHKGNVSRDHDLLPEHCESDLQRARGSYYPVQRYLYDTNFDFPHIYRHYVQVNRDMQVLPLTQE